jgi:hypothetical protein
MKSVEEVKKLKVDVKKANDLNKQLQQQLEETNLTLQQSSEAAQQITKLRELYELKTNDLTVLRNQNKLLVDEVASGQILLEQYKAESQHLNNELGGNEGFITQLKQDLET